MLSQMYETFFIVSGIFCSFVVCAISFISTNSFFGYALLKYIPWLFLQIFTSSIHMLRLIIMQKPSDLSPNFVELDSGTDDHFITTLIANSITLTPGTVSIFTEGRKILVHALTQELSEGVPEIKDHVNKM